MRDNNEGDTRLAMHLVVERYHGHFEVGIKTTDIENIQEAQTIKYEIIVVARIIGYCANR